MKTEVIKVKKYSFREFSKMSKTTLRTLRYYESIGLIIPISENGKKCIEENNLVKLQTIQLLQKAGYTLEEIKQIIKDKNIEDQIIMQKDVLNIQLTNIKTMLSLIETLQNQEHTNITEIYRQFLQIQNKQNLLLQFGTPEGLQKRILFHHQHTHFEENFQQWLFSHYHFNQNAKVLEIGCGDGTLWQCNKNKIPKDIEITLSDISQKMLDECYSKLNDVSQIKSYEYADCFHLPYDDESFDIVIANHVFMYFENVQQALKEIYRVLKKDGILYCSTIAKDMMKERDELLKDFDSKISFNQDILYQQFGYENGKLKLSQYFKDIELFERKEVYEIIDVNLFYQFILSTKGISTNFELLYKKKKQFYDFLKDYFSKHKVFYLTTHCGMFKAKK